MIVALCTATVVGVLLVGAVVDRVEDGSGRDTDSATPNSSMSPNPPMSPSPVLPSAGPLPPATPTVPAGSPASAPATPPVVPPSRPPGPATTGVPAGVALTRHDGDLVITEDGTVIEGLEVFGVVRVRAADVVIRDSIVHGGDERPAMNTALIVAAHSRVRDLVVEDTELVPTTPSVHYNGINGADFTLRRVDIHDVVDAVHVYGDDVTVESSWLHDLAWFPVDETHDGGPTHNDGVQVQNGHDIRIIGNTIENVQNAALQVTQDQGATGRLTFDDNLASGGACTVNISEDGTLGPVVGLEIARNVFGPGSNGYGCPMIIDSATKKTAVVTGNVFTSGAVARARER